MKILKAAFFRGVETDYLHGIGIDEPVMMDRAGAKYYYFRDGLGSIREMTDNGGTVQNSYNYGAWGEIRNQSAVVLNTYGYTGREFSEDGLYFYRARYYDPIVAQFHSKESFIFQNYTVDRSELSYQIYIRRIQTALIDSSKKIDAYIYVSNNPVNFIDPLGEDKCPPTFTFTTIGKIEDATIRQGFRYIQFMYELKLVDEYIITQLDEKGLCKCNVICTYDIRRRYRFALTKIEGEYKWEKWKRWVWCRDFVYVIPCDWAG